MSLVGARPSLAYEVEYFSPQHFERFLVPAGLTGLWQVTARAQRRSARRSTWTSPTGAAGRCSLDLRLLFHTPVQVIARRASTR